MSENDIPQSMQDFAREIGEVCRKHKLSSFRGTFNPSSFQDHSLISWNNFELFWESGRHFADSGTINVVGTQRMNVKIPFTLPEKGGLGR